MLVWTGRRWAPRLRLVCARHAVQVCGLRPLVPTLRGCPWASFFSGRCDSGVRAEEWLIPDGWPCPIRRAGGIGA